jgi:hypothetical protein
MIAVLALIESAAIGLYLLIVAVVLWNMWQWLRARAEIRATYFELERDLARLRQVNAITVIVLAIQAAFLILGVQFAAMPYLRRENALLEIQRQTVATDGTFATATPAAVVAQGLDIEPADDLESDDNPIIQFTPAPTFTPIGTIIPNPPNIEGCNDPRSTLQVPANGMRVFQPITVIGTAYTDNFTSAKIEISGPGTNNTYAVVGETLLPVRENAAFSQFTPAAYTEGLYKFRLMVFDVSGSPVASCMVNIYITDFPATATTTATPPPAATPGNSTTG